MEKTGLVAIYLLILAPCIIISWLALAEDVRLQTCCMPVTCRGMGSMNFGHETSVDLAYRFHQIMFTLSTKGGKLLLQY